MAGRNQYRGSKLDKLLRISDCSVLNLKWQIFITLRRLRKYYRVGAGEMPKPRALENCSEVVSSRHSTAIALLI